MHIILNRRINIAFCIWACIVSFYLKGECVMFVLASPGNLYKSCLSVAGADSSGGKHRYKTTARRHDCMIYIFFAGFFIPEDYFAKAEHFKIIKLTKPYKILKRKNIFQPAFYSEVRYYRRNWNSSIRCPHPPYINCRRDSIKRAKMRLSVLHQLFWRFTKLPRIHSSIIN